MKILTRVTLLFTHTAAVAIGFAIGIYALPILIAPPSPSNEAVEAMSTRARYSAEFSRNLAGSDAFHWGEDYITLVGRLAPGPDYKLYLSPEFVETEAEFEALKTSMALVGDVDTFENFVVAVRPGIDLAEFSTVVIWCEPFGEFITSARYR